MSTDPRYLAWEVLRAVEEKQAFANLLLPRLLRERTINDPRDRALATELTYGTLRAQGTLDHVLAAVSSRPLDAVNPGLLDVLRLGAYQLLRTRIPPHAAVGETVALAKRVAGEGPAKFANAVLRRVSERAKTDNPLQAPDEETDPIGFLSITTAHPRWVVEAFRDALDGDLAETRLALEADDARPTVTLVARPGRIERDELAAEVVAAGMSTEPGRWSPYALFLDSGDPGLLKSVRRGLAAVQDEGSQLVALALARAAVPEGPTVDLCAGPGGKAALLADVLAPTPLIAVELAEHRAKLVGQALAGTPGEATVVVADGRSAPIAAGSAARILVDAPCTGLGALRRRPEARWRRQPEDVARLAVLQQELLQAALELVQPGGAVLYATCSPLPAETRAVVNAVLARNSNVVAEDVRPLLGGVPDLGDGPWVQLWPHRHGTDAMHLSLLRRQS